VKNHTLLDIAEMILKITSSNVEIITEAQGMGLSYTGSGNLLNSLNLPLAGLEKGIRQTYERMLK
jgi:hypothetical protein